ncbi:MAG: hypothetical protein GC159_08200 [Phycisphaera sp.]|nr:hypothetical protein [Phycisphaera sp.]
MIHQKFSQSAQGTQSKDSTLELPAQLRKLRAVVLLSGMIRPTRLYTALGTSLLDLPIDGRRRLLNYWGDHVSDLAAALDRETIPVRVLIDRTSSEPVTRHDSSVVGFSVERDLQELRGTGGVLHDMSADYHDDDYLLVANGTQVLTEPLYRLAWELAGLRSDVSLVAHDDGVPSGLMLVRCGALRDIAPRGFIDMKEQALPQIAQSYRVTVLRRARTTGLPIRSLLDYIDALLYSHARLASVDGVVELSTLEPSLQSTFSIIEPTAKVHPSVRVHNSVIMDGATVEEGAVVVRSIVCPQCVVGPGSIVVGEIATNRPIKENQARLA